MKPMTRLDPWRRPSHEYRPGRFRVVSGQTLTTSPSEIRSSTSLPSDVRSGASSVVGEGSSVASIPGCQGPEEPKAKVWTFDPSASATDAPPEPSSTMYTIWDPSGDQNGFPPPSITIVKFEPSGAKV